MEEKKEEELLETLKHISKTLDKIYSCLVPNDYYDSTDCNTILELMADKLTELNRIELQISKVNEKPVEEKKKKGWF